MMHRRVHKVTTASVSNFNGPANLQNYLQTKLANGERIVGTHYDPHNGDWWIITENFGLEKEK